MEFRQESTSGEEEIGSEDNYGKAEGIVRIAKPINALIRKRIKKME